VSNDNLNLHVVTGLPRSGSTLLCNVLNQNPRFWATSTSTLPGLLSVMRHFWSSSVEVKNLLEKERDVTEDRMLRTMRSTIREWHRKEGKQIIFDKSRAWTFNALLLRKLFPESKMIVCVRDLRNVFSSVEKQHRKNPLLDEAQNPEQLTIYKRADTMFSANGLIGGPLRGIEDLIRRTPEPEKNGIRFVKYEQFSHHPRRGNARNICYARRTVPRA